VLGVSGVFCGSTQDATSAAAIGVVFWRRKTRADEEKIRELERSLKAALQNCGAERQGRIRAQQALRKVANSNDSNNSYPLTPIAITRSCFSTRYLFFFFNIVFSCMAC